jgi:hypothetical protein
MMEVTDTPKLVKTKKGVTSYNSATNFVTHRVMTSNWGRVDVAVDATIEAMDRTSTPTNLSAIVKYSPESSKKSLARP